MAGFHAVTDRLVLRRWEPADRAPFAAMNADPEVMRFFPAPLERDASDTLADYCDSRFDALPFGLSAVEERATGEFLGFVGLHRMRWYPDDVEIGWRLRREAWGRGFATEAARFWVQQARDELQLPRLISVIAEENLPSLAVADRLGMRPGWDGERDGVRHVVRVLDFAMNRSRGAQVV